MVLISQCALIIVFTPPGNNINAWNIGVPSRSLLLLGPSSALSALFYGLHLFLQIHTLRRFNGEVEKGKVRG